MDLGYYTGYLIVGVMSAINTISSFPVLSGENVVIIDEVDQCFIY